MTNPESLSLRRRLALEIARSLYQQKVKEHPLRQLFWECTLRCNLHCRHCGSDCKVKAGQQDMPLADFLASTRQHQAAYRSSSSVCHRNGWRTLDA